jgi:nicotinamide-nucleotide amidase
MSVELAQRAARVLGAARKRNLTLIAAESCTGGLLCVLLSEAPGASDAFHGGFVVYTKKNKTAALGIPENLLKEHTAVSEAVAKAMATRALARSPADLAAAITGVAGPEPDEDGNTVGLVHVAVASRGGAVLHEAHSFGRLSRDEIIENAIAGALKLFERAISSDQ